MTRKIRQLLTTPIAAILTALAVAACGTAAASTVGSGGTGTGTGTTGTNWTSTTGQASPGPSSTQLKAFFTCMRSHGVPVQGNRGGIVVTINRGQTAPAGTSTGSTGTSTAGTGTSTAATGTSTAGTGTAATGTSTTGTGTATTGTTTSASTGTQTAISGTSTAGAPTGTGTTGTSTGPTSQTTTSSAPGGGGGAITLSGATKGGNFTLRLVLNGKQVSPAVMKAAMAACSHLLPQPQDVPFAAAGAAMVRVPSAAMRKASTEMRACLSKHGLKGFPRVFGPPAVAFRALHAGHAGKNVIVIRRPFGAHSKLPAAVSAKMFKALRGHHAQIWVHGGVVRVQALRLSAHAKAVAVAELSPRAKRLAKAMAACGGAIPPLPAIAVTRAPAKSLSKK